MQNFMLNLLKKIHWKKQIFQKLPDPKNSRCEHEQPYNFFLVVANFQTLLGNSKKNKITQFKAEKLAVTGEKIFIQLYQKEIFLGLIGKKSFAVITGEPVSALCL